MKIKQIHSKQIILSILMAMLVVSCSDDSDTSDPNKLNVVAKDVEINPTNFPDDNFRAYLLAQDYGADGIITKKEFQKITKIDVPYGISSLKGIEYFVALDTLRCEWKRSLSSLDVSRNTALRYLSCGWNSLSSLDVSHNTALTYLECVDNSLSSLDVSHNTALTTLSCHENSLSSLDVSHNTALKYLFCQYNSLSSLDVSKNTALRSLYCSNNQIRGEAMDALIEGLPQTNGNIYVISYRSDEGNICTKSQVAAIKAKGWTPYLWTSGLAWVEYEGSDDTLQ